MLFGGDTMNAKVKHCDDSVISRTPVIILSNNAVFPKKMLPLEQELFNTIGSLVMN